MPNRIIRDSILSSEKVCALGWPEEVLYRRLMSIADDYGRHEANPQLLRSKCYPLQVDTVRVADITRWLAACQEAGLIALYEVSGKQYLQIENFGQQLRSASKCPAPPAVDSNCQHASANEHLGVSVSVVVSDGADAPAGDQQQRPAQPALRVVETIRPGDPTQFAQAVAHAYGAAYGVAPPPVPLLLAMEIAKRGEWYAPAADLDWWARYFETTFADLFLTDRESVHQPLGPKASTFKRLVSEDCMSGVIERSKRGGAHG